MKTPHPHADMICEWAQDTSRKVQYLSGCKWVDCNDEPLWRESLKYRFAPEPLVVYFRVNGTQIYHSSRGDIGANLKITVDPDTGNPITSEVLK